MVQRLLKYVGCFYCAVVFLANGAQVSVAGGEGEDAVSHNAGKDCLTSGCHASGGWKRFYLGGTIYTDSEGTTGRNGAQVKAVDANGVTVNLTSDRLGNIYSAQSIAAPFTISVSYRGRMVKMPGTASIGGCNADGCHVVSSSGRVYISTKDLDLTGTVTGADTESSSEISYNSDTEHEKIEDWIVKHNAWGSSPSLGTAGTAVANAKVSLSLNGRIKYRTTTDSTGAFTLKKVKASEYTLKVTRKGYKGYKQSYEMKQKDVSSPDITLSKK